MKVCFVNSTRGWGGVKTWTLELIEHLCTHGDEAHVFCRPGESGSGFAKAARARGAVVNELVFGIDFHPLHIRQMRRYFQTQAMDVVVCNVAKDMRIGAIAARLAGVPVVHRVGLPRDVADRPKTRLVHRLVRPRVLVPSHDTAQGLCAELPWLDPDDVSVIHTGKVPAQAPPQKVHTPRTFIMTSQLKPEKGHAEVLDALAGWQAQGYDFRLIVCGRGPEEERLRALAHTLGLAERVTWRGFVPNVRDELGRADAFVLASHSEGLPNALLEAMAAGLVPVARQVGGVAEVWPGGSGQLAHLLVGPQGTAEGLEQAIGAVLQADDDQLQQWQRVAWQTCRERFNLSTQAGDTRELLAGLAVPPSPWWLRFLRGLL